MKVDIIVDDKVIFIMGMKNYIKIDLYYDDYKIV